MTELRFVAPDLRRLDQVSSEVIVCGVWSDVRPLSGLACLLDWRLAGRMSALVRRGYLVGDLGEVVLIPTQPRLPYDKLLACGLGARAGFDEGTFRSVFELMLETLCGLHVKTAVIELPGRGSALLEPERAAEIFLEIVDAPRDVLRPSLFVVEPAEAARRMEKYAQERHRTALRVEGSSGASLAVESSVNGRNLGVDTEAREGAVDAATLDRLRV